MCSTRQARRVCLTRDAVHLAFEGEDFEVDFIPLEEIIAVHDINDVDIEAGLELLDDTDTQVEKGMKVVRIVTEQGGHNSGREYYIQPDSKKFGEIMDTINRFSREARKRRDNHNVFQRAQKRARIVYESFPVQALIVLMISTVHSKRSIYSSL